MHKESLVTIIAEFKKDWTFITNVDEALGHFNIPKTQRKGVLKEFLLKLELSSLGFKHIFSEWYYRDIDGKVTLAFYQVDKFNAYVIDFYGDEIEVISGMGETVDMTVPGNLIRLLQTDERTINNHGWELVHRVVYSQTSGRPKAGDFNWNGEKGDNRSKAAVEISESGTYGTIIRVNTHEAPRGMDLHGCDEVYSIHIEYYQKKGAQGTPDHEVLFDSIWHRLYPKPTWSQIRTALEQPATFIPPLPEKPEPDLRTTDECHLRAFQSSLPTWLTNLFNRKKS